MMDRLNSLDGKLEVVLFDLDGTLRGSRPPYVQTFYDYAVQLGVEDGQERRRRAARWAHYYWASSPELAEDERAFQAMEDQFWVKYAVRSLLIFDCPPQQSQELAPELARYMQEERRFEDYVLPGVPETLSVLKEAGFRLGVLSNRTNPYQEYVADLGLGGYFEVVLAAGEIDAWKPDPKIFHYVIGKMRTMPDRTLYVGDNYYADVIGAQRAGVQPVLLDSEGLFPEVDCPVIRSMGELVVIAQ